MTATAAIFHFEKFRYFSERLKAKLRNAPAMRGICIEALSGYGKTTLVTDFLLNALPKGTIRAWHHCKEEAPQAAWRSLCNALKKLDSASGMRLLRLGLPDEDSEIEAAKLLRGLECKSPTWLVLDDFHNLAQCATLSVWQALLNHECPHLCTVLVGHPLAESLMPEEKPGYLRLGANDLFLTERETGEFAAKAGISLSEEEAAELHRLAGGLALLLFLHLEHYRDNACFAPERKIAELIEGHIWNKLDGASQNFFLRVSPFEAFTLPQASSLLQIQDRATAALIAKVECTGVLRFDASDRLYYPHGYLREFANKAVKDLSDAEQREILRKAGDWCALSQERKTAISYYYQARDFEKIVALDLIGLEDNRLLDLPDAAYADALRDIAANCTRDMKAAHPLSMLLLAFELFGHGCHDEFEALCAEMADLVETDYLRGELLLLEAFSRYNSITAMGERMKRASELTGGKTALSRPDLSWTFGNASVLFMYHRDAGRLDAELADMESYCPYYAAMSGGHGGGGPALMLAETLLNRGEAKEAEISGYKARQDAATFEQISISIGVELFFGRLAILLGDGTAFSHAYGAIAELVEKHPQKSNRMGADLARSYLAALLHRPQDAAQWLRHGPIAAFGRRLLAPAIPFAHICRARLLLLERKPDVLIDESEAVLGLAAALNYTLGLIYGYIHISAALIMLDRGGEAVSPLRKALDLALPDALYLPFAENHHLIGPLLKNSLPGIRHKEALPRIKALAKQMKAGQKSVAQTSQAQALPVSEDIVERQAGENNLGKFHAFVANYDLTDKETVVLSHILSKLSIKEMAENMGISTSGIEKHVSNIFDKTGVIRQRYLRQLYADWKKQSFFSTFQNK